MATTTTILPVNGTAITNSTDVTTTGWYAWHTTAIDVGLDQPTMWYYATSGGAPTVEIKAHVTIFDCPNHNTAPTTPVSGGTNYRTVTLLSSSVATLSAWTPVDLPSEFTDYPYKFVRFTIEVGTADTTAFYLALAKKARG